MILVILVLLIGSSRTEENSLQTPPSPVRILTDTDTESTIEFERTAIAQFTQSPELVASMTPFYAQIIYNEVVRNLTEVPAPQRPCYLNPSNVPENAATPLIDCGPFIATIVLNDQAIEFTELLNRSGIVGTVGIESHGLEQAREPFVAVSSRLGFAITVDTIDNQLLLTDTIETLIDFILQNWEHLEFVSTNAEIYIEINGQDGSNIISTNYSVLYTAKRNGLTGESLIQAIGGWKEANN